MDFRRLSKAMPSLPPPSPNSTDPTSWTDLPPNILDALIPGYSIISRFVQAVFGLDISLFVSLAAISLALVKGSQFLYSRAEHVFRYLFISSVYIDEHDDLFDMVMDWIAATQTAASRRSVSVQTLHGNKAADEDLDPAAAAAVLNNGMFDYNKWSARTPPRYEPYYGRHLLWHHGRLFLFRRSHRTTPGSSLQVRFGSNREDDLIQLDCIGRSVAPLRDMLNHIKAWSLNKQRNTTTIRHPTPKDRARFGGAWSKTYSRPSRPMDTVILDAEQKAMIINDMNEYLHPSSPKWYATRGIPYRRGYLFHGPPGTGKTSLSFALAGVFALEIFCISLQEPTLTEGDLMQLFNGLPRRCIVLLEDVDAAGLLRDGKSGTSEAMTKKRTKKGAGKDKKKADESKTDPSAAKPKKDEDYTLKDLARELKSLGSSPKSKSTADDKSSSNNNNNNNNSNAGGNPHRQPGTGISLSGLLNAIDGVASHEGRVLIMTTNHPEKLDAALVRPGRVDRRVEFGLALRPQVRELFVRMYAAGEQRSPANAGGAGRANGSVGGKGQANGSANGHISAAANEKHTRVDSVHHHPPAPEKDQDGDDLEDLASAFAEKIPDDTFTPAEIQNLLMRHKKEPRVAVEQAEAWARETVEEKEKVRKAKDEEEEEDDEEDDDDGEGKRDGEGGED